VPAHPSAGHTYQPDTQQQIGGAIPAGAAVDLPPWEAPTPLQNTGPAGAIDNRLITYERAPGASVESLSVGADLPFEAEAELPDEGSLTAAAATVPDAASDDDEEQHSNVAGDWQWQTMSDSSTSESGQRDAGLPEQSAQPIRHALLDSLALQAAQDTDFASEQIENITPVVIDSGPLSFDGEINSQNFALRSASQVDEWARRIDSLPIGGLMRLFLLSSSLRREGDLLVLTVAQSQRHLDSERNRLQLAQVLSQSFGEPLQVDVQFVAEVPQSPQALQQRIDQARRLYVQSVLEQDPLVQSLQADFQAQWLADSLEVF
jgi:DNA polymerase-3 subunit gamma/tau